MDTTVLLAMNLSGAMPGFAPDSYAASVFEWGISIGLIAATIFLYCPTCGGPPAMGQLSGTDPGRLRLLSCGRCGTRWRYRRTGCPFCENEDTHKLSVMAVDGEGGLRIDYCEACAGYLKTYNGDGSERVLLADWTSLHLDIAARERGLKRLAGSLYEL